MYPFMPPRYILISYLASLMPLVGLGRAGPYFRSVEALVQGHGWEPWLPADCEGSEPDVEGVLTVTAGGERGPFYGVWRSTMGKKNARVNWKEAVVEGVGGSWKGREAWAVDEVRWWLACG